MHRQHAASRTAGDARARARTGRAEQVFRLSRRSREHDALVDGRRVRGASRSVRERARGRFETSRASAAQVLRSAPSFRWGKLTVVSGFARDLHLRGAESPRISRRVSWRWASLGACPTNSHSALRTAVATLDGGDARRGSTCRARMRGVRALCRLDRAMDRGGFRRVVVRVGASALRGVRAVPSVLRDGVGRGHRPRDPRLRQAHRPRRASPRRVRASLRQGRPPPRRRPARGDPRARPTARQAHRRRRGFRPRRPRAPRTPPRGGLVRRPLYRARKIPGPLPRGPRRRLHPRRPRVRKDVRHGSRVRVPSGNPRRAQAPRTLPLVHARTHPASTHSARPEPRETPSLSTPRTWRRTRRCSAWTSSR